MTLRRTLFHIKGCPKCGGSLTQKTLRDYNHDNIYPDTWFECDSCDLMFEEEELNE